jgi:outer membrane immunogenic protein
MRRIFAGAVLASLFISSAAHAQNWTGFYIGANTGAGWGKTSSVNQPLDPASGLFFFSTDTGFAPGSFDTSLRPDGWLGGLQAGFNWQAGVFVFGVEADIQKSAIDGSFSRSAYIVPANFGALYPVVLNTDSDLEWFGTVRGRVGFLITPNFLLYGTGGLAYGHVDNSASITFAPNVQPSLLVFDYNALHFECRTTAATPTAICYAGSGSDTRIGWTAGFGGEWQLDAHWSVKFEYLHMQLPGVTLNLVSPSPPSTPGVSTNFVFDDFTYDIVRVGLNYRFGAN